MKKKLLKKALVLFFNTIILFLASCKKDVLPTYPGMTTGHDTLKGKEFIFNDLTWEHSTLTTPKRPDLFRYQQLNAQVSMKFDTAITWLQVGPTNAYSEEDPPPYDYGIIDSSLVISNNTFVPGLEGEKAAIKVKF